MAPIPYFARYGRLTSANKEQSALLFSADCIVGDELVLRYDRLGDTQDFHLETRFGGAVGQLDAESTHALQLCIAKQWDVHVLLAAVYQIQGDVPNPCWAEVVAIAYPPSRATSFDPFVAKVAGMLRNGIRPQVDLQQDALEALVEAQGAWEPTDRVPVLNEEGSVLLKSRMTLNESLVEQARAKNPGCMAAGAAFIVALVAGALWVLKTLLGL